MLFVRTSWNTPPALHRSAATTPDVVYSVGEDGRDDGGDEKKDITFTVER
jgi:hypothetical protein